MKPLLRRSSTLVTEARAEIQYKRVKRNERKLYFCINTESNSRNVTKSLIQLFRILDEYRIGIISLRNVSKLNKVIVSAVIADL